MKQLGLVAVAALMAGCQTHAIGSYEPVPSAGYQPPETWERDLTVCAERFALVKWTKGQYRWGFNDCMNRLGHRIDNQASRAKYNDADQTLGN